MPRLFQGNSILLGIILLSAGCTDVGEVVHVDKQEFSFDDQVIIGQNIADYILSDPTSFPIVNANAYPEAYAYLNSLHKSVITTEQVTARNKFRWEIFPINNQDEAFAFTVPGGKFYISTKLLKFLNSESELMAIMASELYYTDRDYLTTNIKEEFGGVMLGDILFGYEVPEIKEIAIYLKDLTISPEIVELADLTALEILCPFNYNIESLSALIDRSYNNYDSISWIRQRPRSDSWRAILDNKANACTTSNGENFRSRYEKFKSWLP